MQSMALLEVFGGWKKVKQEWILYFGEFLGKGSADVTKESKYVRDKFVIFGYLWTRPELDIELPLQGVEISTSVVSFLNITCV